ncbi:MAG: hypothetical protein NMK33_04020 [Candidatus Cardinium sp.]|uniref:hypothetical protein n=1 Tax=Cardinium endosymbiont of Dermatophagoides farinae TaxID=2597823 RepID=UPI0011840BCC|nr:hypothetical protein [Cardinium endosymbiont of Dermatophagoides farinae]TSJ80605.1 hypothetical protein FPG78_00745 [Cardinium endosymbiont of Dermatophagoides farinae]UWW96598.1 MAG: hypothetical protein NMK33_04020 [Candidatus Cardinium sp.]
MKLLNDRKPFVVLFVWFLGMLFSNSNCPGNSDKKKETTASKKKETTASKKKETTASTAVPNNNTSKQVINEHSSIGGSSSSGSNGSGGEIGNSGGGSDSGSGSGAAGGGSGGGIGSSGDGSSGGIGSSGSDLAGASSSNNSIENISRNNTLRNRILKILKESDFYKKDEKEAMKNYIDSITDEVLIEIQDNLQQAKKSNNDSNVTDNEVLHAIWELIPKNTNDAVVSQSTGNSDAINNASDAAASHGSASGAGSLFGIGITYDGKAKVIGEENKYEIKMMRNSCYIEVLLQIFAALFLGNEKYIQDNTLKSIIEKINEPKDDFLVNYKGNRVVSITKDEIASVWGMLKNKDDKYKQMDINEMLTYCFIPKFCSRGLLGYRKLLYVKAVFCTKDVLLFLPGYCINLPD